MGKSEEHDADSTTDITEKSHKTAASHRTCSQIRIVWNDRISSITRFARSHSQTIQAPYFI